MTPAWPGSGYICNLGSKDIGGEDHGRLVYSVQCCSKNPKFREELSWEPRRVRQCQILWS